MSHHWEYYIIIKNIIYFYSFFFFAFIDFNKCIISGDPHYLTFDKFKHHYQGPYTYVLTKDYDLPTFLTPLTVRGKNARRGGNRRVSFLREVYVEVYGVSIQMLQKKGLLVRKCKICVKCSIHACSNMTHTISATTVMKLKTCQNIAYNCWWKMNHTVS